MKNIRETLESYLACLNQEKAAFEHTSLRLKEEGRLDEANHARIQSSLCEVFCALAKTDATLSQKAGEDMDAFCRRFLGRFETIPAPWRLRLKVAKEHGDVGAAVTEELKLATAERFRENFLHLTEERAHG